MKMRKYFVMALVALGATAAFSSCQKDEKAYDAPKVEFRDANNTVIKEFNQASFGTNKEITVVVTLGDPKEVTLKKLEVSVVTDNSTIKKPYTVSTITGNSGDTKGKQVGTVKLGDLQIAEGDYAKSGLKIVAVATDSRAKETKEYCVYKAKGGETPKETLMQVGKENAYINNITGPNDALGSYSFTDGMAKESSASAAERQLVNTSVAGEGFVANFKSEAGFKFHKVDLKYDGVTVEGVKKALEGKTPEAEIKDLKKGNLFVVVKDVENDPFYLVEVTEVVAGKTTSYIDKTGNVKEGPANTNGGYMKFRYKKSK